MEHPALQLDLIPHDSGVYRFLNKEGTIIYVGKAKDLKKRVSQYFQSTRSHSVKTRRMVSQIHAVEFTVVATESDALLLENNLIKTIKPKYNILLKDDKTYPWICIKKEPFPRVFVTRRMVKDGSLYFGPYTSGYYCNQLITLIHTLFPLRTCSLSLQPSAIAQGKYAKCLEAHIGRCKAPCLGLEDQAQYAHYIESAKHILKGEAGLVRKLLEEKMMQAAAACDFEQAQHCKEQLEALGNHQAKSVIVSQQITDVDVFSLVLDPKGDCAYGNTLRVSSGAVVQSQNVCFKLRIEEPPEAILSLFIASLQEQRQGLNKEVLVPFMPDAVPSGCRVSVPVKGDKHELVELSLRNARNYRMEQMRLAEKRDTGKRIERRAKDVLLRLQTDLGMAALPLHIECFDNSNLQGTHPVASCVVFRNAKPSKKDYRHFLIKTVVGPDDFASMTEVVTRRYRRLLDEQTPLPQLVVIDGGKGQLSAAYEALTGLGLQDAITLVGLAKRLEEIYVVGDALPLFLDKNSPSLRLLMQLRDEAHRFGITFHRQQRSADFAQTTLTNIPGIGPATAAAVLRHFKSVKQLSMASEEALAAVIGPAKAHRLWNGIVAASSPGVATQQPLDGQE